MDSPTCKFDQGRAADLEALKAGCQWRELSIKEYFKEGEITWHGIYYHFNKWSRDGFFKRVWVLTLRANPTLLDLSSLEQDCCHMPAKNGLARPLTIRTERATACLCDNHGQILAVELVAVLKEAGIEIRWLFINAGPGFDSDI